MTSITTTDTAARLARSCARLGYKLLSTARDRYTIVTESGTPIKSALSLGEVATWIRNHAAKKP
jgi:hypothetical protein